MPRGYQILRKAQDKSKHFSIYFKPYRINQSKQQHVRE